MASKIIRTGVREVAPVMSANKAEAKRRVLNLYRAWYRQIPSIGKNIILVSDFKGIFEKNYVYFMFYCY